MHWFFAVVVLCALIAIGAMLPYPIRMGVGLFCTLYFMGFFKEK